MVRYRRQVHAELFGDRRVRLARIDLRADEPGQSKRRQPVALLVPRDLGIAIGGQVAHDSRNLMKPGSNSRAQPLGAEVDAVPAVAIGRMHDERLQDAALLDVRSELCSESSGNSVRGLCASSYSSDTARSIGLPPWPMALGVAGGFDAEAI